MPLISAFQIRINIIAIHEYVADIASLFASLVLTVHKVVGMLIAKIDQLLES